MKRTNRREFLTCLSVGTIGTSLADILISAAPGLSKGVARSKRLSHKVKFSLGIASYTFRHFNLDQTLEMTQRLGIGTIAFKDFHLPLDSSEEQIKAVAEKVKRAGLRLYGCGVVYMKNEHEVQRAFDYARAAGMELIIGVPEHDLLPLVDRKSRNTISSWRSTITAPATSAIPAQNRLISVSVFWIGALVSALMWDIRSVLAWIQPRRSKHLRIDCWIFISKMLLPPPRRGRPSKSVAV